MADLLVHGLQVAGGGAPGGVHPLLDAGPRSVTTAIWPSSSFWVAINSARRPIEGDLFGLQGGQLALETGEPAALGQGGPLVLQLGDRRVEVLYDQQLAEGPLTGASASLMTRLTHDMVSHCGRAMTNAGASASSAMAPASSQPHQRASGLSPGGGAGSSSGPIRR